MAKKKRETKTPQLSLVAGDFPPEFTDLANNIADEYRYLRTMKPGKTGRPIAVQSRKNEHQQYCVKTPRLDLTPEQFEHTRARLKNEVEILSPLSHRCLPQVFDFNIATEQPYYICTLHPGTTFLEFRSSKQHLPFRESVFVVWSLMDVLSYLHSSGRTHCDLHAENVMIDKEVFRHGILVIDFSSGHRESSTSPETLNVGNPALKGLVGQSVARQRVNRRDYAASFRESDFVALGKLLALMRDSFFADANQLVRASYLDFCGALQDGRIASWEDAEDRFLTVLDPMRSINDNTDLFLLKDGRRDELIIPVSGTVPVGEGSLAVVNCRVFQRLRGLRQLAFCEWLFPGASHTRFEHALGVFGLAEQALKHLSQDRIFRDVVTRQEVRGFLLACLVHDIGHYPFAHVVEQYVVSRFHRTEFARAKELAFHSVWSKDLLRNDPELVSVIKEFWGIEAIEHAAKTLSKEAGILSSLIDGAIDLDKLDYLARDSYHCGYRFGDGLDVEGVLRSYRCLGNGRELGVSEDGVPAVEGFVVLQDQMLSSVYWHPVVRGIICMFHTLLAALIGQDVVRLEKLVINLKKCGSEQEALEKVIGPAISYAAKSNSAVKGAEPRLRELLETFMNPRYTGVYRVAATYKATDGVPKGRVSTVYRSIVAGGGSQPVSLLPIDWDQVKALRSSFLHAVRMRMKDATSMDVFVDVPYGKSTHRSIAVQAGNVEIDITRLSHLNESMFTQPTAFIAPVRVYLSPRVMQAVEHELVAIIVDAENTFFGKRSEGQELAGL